MPRAALETQPRLVLRTVPRCWAAMGRALTRPERSKRLRSRLQRHAAADVQRGPVLPILTSAKADQQRLRRLRVPARRNAMRCMLLLCDLTVLPACAVVISDIARQRLLADGLRSRGCSLHAIVGALLVDWAVRCPAFSKEVLESVQQGRGPQTSCIVLVQHMLWMRARQTWPCFWKGRARTHPMATAEPAGSLPDAEATQTEEHMGSVQAVNGFWTGGSVGRYRLVVSGRLVGA
jgi:hypothetical protein